MATRTSPAKRQRPKSTEATERAITGITVAGFKSIRDEQSIDIRPLTILAGANSSGKSSMMQPLLLLKQTLDSPSDPGALLLDGPNVRFTDAEQFLSRTSWRGCAGAFQVGFSMGGHYRVASRFRKDKASQLRVVQTEIHGGFFNAIFTDGMSDAEVRAELPARIRSIYERGKVGTHWTTVRQRCFIWPARGEVPVKCVSPGTDAPELIVRRIIHVSGFRGNPNRVWPAGVIAGLYPGEFHVYTARVLSQWERSNSQSTTDALCNDLQSLGLSSRVETSRISDAQLGIYVARLPPTSLGASRDPVNIADVGLGVSHVLPVLVALHVATPDHLVYIEQPEIHLHPRAQVAMATVLARAVRRGVRMVVETHSGLLLRAVQALVAEGKEGLTPDLVKLHWFTRSKKDGTTTISTADLDDAGAFGDWPEDFGDVELDIESRYLDAAQARMSKK
jgi:hypothetical protein